jgi:hypothetical protein
MTVDEVSVDKMITTCPKRGFVIIVANFNKKISASGLYNKHFMTVNDDSSIVKKIEASLTDDARVVIYDLHKFIVQATAIV